MLCRFGHLGLAKPLAQHVADVAAPAAGAIVRSAAQARGAVPNRAGEEPVAGDLVIRAGARVSLFGKASQEAVFVAVEKGLDAVEPIVGRSAT